VHGPLPLSNTSSLSGEGRKEKKGEKEEGGEDVSATPRVPDTAPGKGGEKIGGRRVLFSPFSLGERGGGKKEAIAFLFICSGRAS